MIAVLKQIHTPQFVFGQTMEHHFHDFLETCAAKIILFSFLLSGTQIACLHQKGRNRLRLISNKYFRPARRLINFFDFRSGGFTQIEFNFIGRPYITNKYAGKP